MDLTIKAGESVVIIGRSGCGKSVTLKHIIGVMRPESGRVLIEDTDITKISSRGQLVIPQEIREDAQVKPDTKFIVFNEDDYIILKPIKKEIKDLKEEMEELKEVKEADEQLKKGEFLKISGNKSVEEITNILERHKWK